MYGSWTCITHPPFHGFMDLDHAFHNLFSWINGSWLCKPRPFSWVYGSWPYATHPFSWINGSWTCTTHPLFIELWIMTMHTPSHFWWIYGSWTSIAHPFSRIYGSWSSNTHPSSWIFGTWSSIAPPPFMDICIIFKQITPHIQGYMDHDQACHTPFSWIYGSWSSMIPRFSGKYGSRSSIIHKLFMDIWIMNKHYTLTFHLYMDHDQVCVMLDHDPQIR